ncbi:hypothetical protein J3R82DRAFT_5056 [Butyriboletus roseoflavus]|nr:hypothetical protein J3R82DRAFT_5056 [Butyriboletus roseoflavus]
MAKANQLDVVVKSLIELNHEIERQHFHYNILCDIIRKLVTKHLDTSLTLTQQKNKLLIEQIVLKAQSKSCTLRRYKGGWAIHDMIAQFLRNRSACEQKVAVILTKRGDHASRSSQKTYSSDTFKKSDASDSVDEGKCSGTDSKGQESNNEMESVREKRVKPRTKRTDGEVKPKSKSKVVSETKKTIIAKVKLKVKDTKSRDEGPKKKKLLKVTKSDAKEKAKEVTEHRPTMHSKNGLDINPSTNKKALSDSESNMDSNTIPISNWHKTKKAPHRF